MLMQHRRTLFWAWVRRSRRIASLKMKRTILHMKMDVRNWKGAKRLFRWFRIAVFVATLTLLFFYLRSYIGVKGVETGIVGPSESIKDLPIVTVRNVFWGLGVIVAVVIILLTLAAIILATVRIKKRKLRVAYSGAAPASPAASAAGATTPPTPTTPATPKNPTGWGAVLAFLKTPALFSFYIVGGWFLAMGILRVYLPDQFTRLRVDHPVVFWFTPWVWLAADLLRIPEKKQPNILAALCVIITIPSIALATVDVAFNVKYVDIKKYWNESTVATVSTRGPATVLNPINGKGGWRKPFGIDGRNPGVREVTFDVRVVKNNDDIMEFYVPYVHESGDYEAHFIWDKKKSEMGTWDQPRPCERGQWFLKETEPGSGKYEGAYTDGSLKGEWIPLWLELSK